MSMWFWWLWVLVFVLATVALILRARAVRRFEERKRAEELGEYVSPPHNFEREPAARPRWWEPFEDQPTLAGDVINRLWDAMWTGVGWAFRAAGVMAGITAFDWLWRVCR